MVHASNSKKLIKAKNTLSTGKKARGNSTKFLIG